VADLQRRLNGYSDYIGRYTGGNVNLQDSNVLVPTISMEDFINERKVLAFDTSFTAVDQVAGITVPEGKQWRVHFASTYLSAQGGQQILYELHWRRVFGGATRYYPIDQLSIIQSPGSNNLETGNGRTKGHASTDLNIIIPAGDGLGVSVSDLAGAGNFSTRFVCQVSEYNL
jgi:hypothetical protein